MAEKKNPPKAVKKTSRTPIPYEYFKATEIMPGEGPMIQPEIIREQLIRMMTDMDQKGVERMADYVVYLIVKLRDLPNAGQILDP